jgi:D-3-phosphoglycerate dehydrogenase
MTFKAVMVVANPTIPHDEDDYRKLGVEFVTRPCQTEDDIIAAAADADFVLTFKITFTRRVIENLKNCKMVYNIGTGYESIDLKAATEQGICVTYPDGYCSDEVAEHAMAFILACARKLFPLDRAVREGKWDSYEKREVRFKILPPMHPLKGQTVGVVGLGRIGQKLVPMARGFGLRVIGYDPYIPAAKFQEINVESVSFDFLLENADFISLHAAFTPEAHHMFGAEQFKRMKPTAYLINCARGDFVAEEALYQALSQKEIAGAAIDVVQAEKISPDHLLLRLENLIITPHTAYYSEESLDRLKRRPYEEIARMVNGEWPQWLINTEVKDKFLSRWGKSALVKTG